MKCVKSCKVMINCSKYFLVALLIITIFFSYGIGIPLYSDDDEKDEWLAKDKALHTAFSCGIDIVAYDFYRGHRNYSKDKALVYAFTTTLAIGAAKEFIDDRFSWKDIGADVLGAGIGTAISLKF